MPYPQPKRAFALSSGPAGRLVPSPRSRASLPMAWCREDSLHPPPHRGRTGDLLPHLQKWRVCLGSGSRSGPVPPRLTGFRLAFREGSREGVGQAPRSSQPPPLLPWRLSPVSCGSEPGKEGTLPCIWGSWPTDVWPRSAGGKCPSSDLFACWLGRTSSSCCATADRVMGLSLRGGAGPPRSSAHVGALRRRVRGPTDRYGRVVCGGFY